MLKFLLSSLLAIVIIFALSKSVDLKSLVSEIRNFDIVWAVLLLPLTIVITLLRSWRFFLLLHNSKIKINYLESTKIFTAGYATSALPAGEATRAVLVRRQTGTDLPRATSAVVAQAYFELLAAAVTALIGSLLVKIGILPSFLVLLGLILLALLMIWDQAINSVTRLIAKIKIADRIRPKLLQTQNLLKPHLFDTGSGLPDKIAVRSVGIGILANLFGGVLILALCAAYQVPIHLFSAVFIYSAALLIQGLSFTPGGLGFTEGGMSGLLLLNGVPFDRALSIVLLYRAFTLLLPTLTGGIFLLVFYSNIAKFARKLTTKLS